MLKKLLKEKRKKASTRIKNNQRVFINISFCLFSLKFLVISDISQIFIFQTLDIILLFNMMIHLFESLSLLFFYRILLRFELLQNFSLFL